MARRCTPPVSEMCPSVFSDMDADSLTGRSLVSTGLGEGDLFAHGRKLHCSKGKALPRVTGARHLLFKLCLGTGKSNTVKVIVPFNESYRKM